MLIGTTTCCRNTATVENGLLRICCYRGRYEGVALSNTTIGVFKASVGSTCLLVAVANEGRGRGDAPTAIAKTAKRTTASNAVGNSGVVVVVVEAASTMTTPVSQEW